VFGDTTYGSKRKKSADEPVRQLLHAKKLSFIDPNGDKKVFMAPIPRDIKQYIGSLSEL
jgi:23S rRNA-/tRNA-specific pseudouridylate synthase